MPEVKRVLLVGLNISIKGRTTNAEGQEKLKLLLQLTFYLIDKLRRFKLSKEVRYNFFLICLHFLRCTMLFYIDFDLFRVKVKLIKID